MVCKVGVVIEYAIIFIVDELFIVLDGAFVVDGAFVLDGAVVFDGAVIMWGAEVCDETDGSKISDDAVFRVDNSAFVVDALDVSTLSVKVVVNQFTVIDDAAGVVEDVEIYEGATVVDGNRAAVGVLSK